MRFELIFSERSRWKHTQIKIAISKQPCCIAATVLQRRGKWTRNALGKPHRGRVGPRISPERRDGRTWFLPLPTGDVLPGDGTPPHDDPRHAGRALADRHS